MWLVVYKEEHYPSVFECQTEDEAKDLYNKLKKSEFDNLEGEVNERGKLYLTEIKETEGTFNEDVAWYVNPRF